jgi:hypothetical protein
VDIEIAKVQGADACGECHTYEMEAWKKSTHFATYSTMHTRPRAKEIAEKMGEKSIKRNDLCFTCHYTAREIDGKVKSVSGVSCESCHGASQDWISPDLHHEKAKDAASPAEREALLARCEEVGMLRPRNIYRVAKNCYSCHSVPHEDLVNVGGHKAGSDFELVSWSQGEVRHNYQYSTDQVNKPASMARKRVLFVVGAMTALEFNLRACTKVTKRGPYLDAMKKRLPRSLKNAHKVADAAGLTDLKAALPALDNAVVRTLLTKPAEATAAADTLSRAIEAWVASTDGHGLEGVDGLMPGPDAYHGTAQP